MNRFGYPEEYMTIQEYKDFIEENFGEQAALLDDGNVIVVEKNSDEDYNIMVNTPKQTFFKNLEDLFNAKVINGKCLNDYSRVDRLDF